VKTELQKYKKKRKCSLQKREWILCKSECHKKLKALANSEIESTKYMLNVLQASVLSGEKIKFDFRSPLSGKWMDDKEKISMRSMHNGKSRLIVCFGPSACGKSFWTDNVIRALKNKNFPKDILAIDGDIARQTSNVYRAIAKTAVDLGYAGVLNLVAAKPGVPNIFNSSLVKKRILSFLEDQRKRNVVFSLYVPLTLGKCLVTCPTPERYIEMMRDPNWVALLVYQHRESKDCVYKSEFKCAGCSESGKNREMKSGKKYSSSSYNNALRQSHRWVKKGGGTVLFVHNSGSKSRKSIVLELPVKGKFTFNSKSFKNTVYLRDTECFFRDGHLFMLPKKLL